MAVKGKWAQGIEPRNFRWVMKDVLGACERPGGYGANHRRVRRQEEIIWVREQGFTKVISIIPASHNLHAYTELEVSWIHRPFRTHDDPAAVLAVLRPDELAPTFINQFAYETDTRDGFLGELMIAAIMGQFGRIFFAGALTEQTLRVLFLRKPPYMGQLVPAEGVIRFAGNLAYPVRDIVTWDTEHMQADIMRLLKSIALTRLPVKIYEAAAGDE